MFIVLCLGYDDVASKFPRQSLASLQEASGDILKPQKPELFDK